MKENLYPCCSAIPVIIIFDDDPNKVPFPPRQAPKDKAQTSGCNGKLKSLLSASVVIILTIIVANGILSTKAEAKADTHSTNSTATASRCFGSTDMIMSWVKSPMYSIKPSFPNASISTKREAKKMSVDHSTLVKIGARSSSALRIKRRRTPRSAAQPNPKRPKIH